MPPFDRYSCSPCAQGCLRVLGVFASWRCSSRSVIGMHNLRHCTTWDSRGRLVLSHPHGPRSWQPCPAFSECPGRALPELLRIPMVLFLCRYRDPAWLWQSEGKICGIARLMSHSTGKFPVKMQYCDVYSIICGLARTSMSEGQNAKVWI